MSSMIKHLSQNNVNICKLRELELEFFKAIFHFFPLIPLKKPLANRPSDITTAQLFLTLLTTLALHMLLSHPDSPPHRAVGPVHLCLECLFTVFLSSFGSHLRYHFQRSLLSHFNSLPHMGITWLISNCTL